MVSSVSDSHCAHPIHVWLGLRVNLNAGPTVTVPPTRVVYQTNFRFGTQGRYTYDVRKIFGFFQPLPPLVRNFCTGYPQNWVIKAEGAIASEALVVRL